MSDERARLSDSGNGRVPEGLAQSNHEALLENFLDELGIGSQWRHLGGVETLHSFGVPVTSLMVGRNYDQAAAQFRTALTSRKIDVIRILGAFLTTLRKKHYSAGGRYSERRNTKYNEQDHCAGKAN